jgi:hypothetical protein
MSSGTSIVTSAAQLSRLQTLRSAGVLALIKAAVAQAKTPLPAKGEGHMVIKSVSAKQRPRRKAQEASRG